MRHRILITVALCALSPLGACVRPPWRVPVVAPDSGVAALEGSWSGEYASEQTGRHGSIAFSLQPGADAAEGYVWMTPRRVSAPAALDSAGPPLSISFVRVRANDVSGTLQPYRDPDCGCDVRTVFDGRLSGDTIAGTYTTRRVRGDSAPTSGHWRVVRRPASSTH